MFYEMRALKGRKGEITKNISKLSNFFFLLKSFDRIKTTIMILNKFYFLKVLKLKQFLIEFIIMMMNMITYSNRFLTI